MIAPLLALTLLASPPRPGLISTDSLAALLDREPVTILDVRQAWTSYLQNHIPGATWLNIETLRSSDGGLPFQLFPADQYALIFGRAGARAGRTVVIYSAGDQLDIDATFVAWILAGFGQSKVFLLDGGYAKWELEGRRLTQTYPHDQPSGGKLDPRRFALATATLESVRGAVSGAGSLLVDARPGDQYSGSAGAQRRRGHIPGAVSHPWKNDLEQRDLVTVWKSADSLRAAYAAQGITPERDIVVYCNSSTEASHVFFALHDLLDYPKVRIYTGAWSEWAEREDLPIE